MPALVAAYCRSNTVNGFLVRIADRWGRWSHCGLLTADETVIEAREFHGVVEVPRGQFAQRYANGALEYRVIECPNPEAAIAWAREQKGKGYDYGAIFGNLARESWQDEARWTCSELLEAALVQGGRQRFNDAAWRISPNLSAMVR